MASGWYLNADFLIRLTNGQQNTQASFHNTSIHSKCCHLDSIWFVIGFPRLKVILPRSGNSFSNVNALFMPFLGMQYEYPSSHSTTIKITFKYTSTYLWNWLSDYICERKCFAFTVYLRKNRLLIQTHHPSPLIPPSITSRGQCRVLSFLCSRFGTCPALQHRIYSKRATSIPP